MSRDPRVRLDDVVQYADEAIAFLAGMSYNEFAADVRTQRAVFYSLLVVGEAAKARARRRPRQGAAREVAGGDALS